MAVLDPDVTESPTKGLYIVYLFSDDRTKLYLSLNQGVTDAVRIAREVSLGTNAYLKLQAAGLRAVMGEDLNALDIEIDLGKGGLLSKYEAGNIVAKTYHTASLPAAEHLVSDLRRFLDLYSTAVPQAEYARVTGQNRISLPARSLDLVQRPVSIRFEPKDASDYRAHIAAQEQVRTRSHEDLVRRFGEWSMAHGFTPNTNVHPRDLVLHRAGRPDVLVEVKVFPAGRPRNAVREAIGQLFEYSHFYPSAGLRLVAALSTRPGDAYCALLEQLKIGVVWPFEAGWTGSPEARRLGIVE